MKIHVSKLDKECKISLSFKAEARFLCPGVSACRVISLDPP